MAKLRMFRYDGGVVPRFSSSSEISRNLFGMGWGGCAYWMCLIGWLNRAGCLLDRRDFCSIFFCSILFFIYFILSIWDTHFNPLIMSVYPSIHSLTVSGHYWSFAQPTCVAFSNPLQSAPAATHSSAAPHVLVTHLLFFCPSPHPSSLVAFPHQPAKLGRWVAIAPDQQPPYYDDDDNR